MILELVGTADGRLIIDSDNGYLAAFSMYLAALVLFRVIFATLHICKWKFRYNFRNDYSFNYKCHYNSNHSHCSHHNDDW